MEATDGERVVRFERAAELLAKDAEIERLRDLAAAMMALLDQMPVKHPQQSERRNELRRQFRYRW